MSAVVGDGVGDVNRNPQRLRIVVRIVMTNALLLTGVFHKRVDRTHTTAWPAIVSPATRSRKSLMVLYT